MSVRYEIVRVYDDGSSEVWDDAETLKAAEAVAVDLDGYLSGSFRHRIYEVRRRLISFAERKRLRGG